MKRIFAIVAVAAVVALCSTPAMATPPNPNTGNGAQSGPHYNLNLIGHEEERCPTNPFEDSNRHTIHVLLNFNDGNNHGDAFVTLDKRNKIFLVEGDFQVLDGNACNGDGATFQLPANPFTCTVEDLEDGLCDDPTFQEYLVYARALGSPKGNPSVTITTCAVDDLDTADPNDDVVVCSTESVVLVRTKGKSSFSNVTKELTTLCLDTDGNGICDTRIGIFDDSLETYFWDYDNNGVRLVQLRFYPIQD